MQAPDFSALRTLQLQIQSTLAAQTVTPFKSTFEIVLNFLRVAQYLVNSSPLRITKEYYY